MSCWCWCCWNSLFHLHFPLVHCQAFELVSNSVPLSPGVGPRSNFKPSETNQKNQEDQTKRIVIVVCQRGQLLTLTLSTFTGSASVQHAEPNTFDNRTSTTALKRAHHRHRGRDCKDAKRKVKPNVNLKVESFRLFRFLRIQITRNRRDRSCKKYK